MENLTPQPSPMGVLISRMLIIKAKPYTMLEGRSSSLGEGNFVFSVLFTLFSSQSLAGQKSSPLGKESVQWWGVEENVRALQPGRPKTEASHFAVISFPDL